MVQDLFFDEIGEVVYYVDYFEGSLIVLGEIYYYYFMIVVYVKLLFGIIVKVICFDNGLVIIVCINDRGVYCDNCVIDLSWVVV